ncbi:MAG: hypothetical protein JSR77_08850 [Planctomycetes bacterium]|nr:hypothetical protein [Planctomycetota bacterium]
MSDAKATPPAENKDAGAPKGKSPVKAIGIVAVLMIVEAAGVFMFVGKTAPAPVAAAEIKGEHGGDEAESVEIPLIEDKFQNMQTGRVWVWDAEVVLKVKSKQEKFVSKQLETRAAEIKEGLSTIFRKAQHSHLKEPGLETLNRQVTAFINDLIGKDADGKERIERVVIPKCKGFPAD